jgi:hypothetical protein
MSYMAYVPGGGTQPIRRRASSSSIECYRNTGDMLAIFFLGGVLRPPFARKRDGGAF